jgi:hypothetical protein
MAAAFHRCETINLAANGTVTVEVPFARILAVSQQRGNLLGKEIYLFFVKAAAPGKR